MPSLFLVPVTPLLIFKNSACARRLRIALRHSRLSATFVTCRGSFAKGSEGGDGWIMDNASLIRNMPVVVGGCSFFAVLLNRVLSGIPAIADASSAQSRTDVLAVSLSATVMLTGLVWKSVESRPQFPVPMNGINCMRVATGLKAEAAHELIWAWEALSVATNAVALVVVYGNTCVLQAGLAAESSEQGNAIQVDTAELLQGSLCTSVMTSKKQMYLANLALYPSRFELHSLPSNTQAVIVQPVGDDGVMLVASDTLRGFGPCDQGWIVAIGEKLDITLADGLLYGPLNGHPEQLDKII